MFASESKRPKEKESPAEEVVYDVAPVPIEELLQQGTFITFYGETTSGKSNLLASLAKFNKKDKEKWQAKYPMTAKMMDDGFFPDLSEPGSIAVIDLDKKWGTMLSKGDWVKYGYLKCARDGIYKIYQVVLPEREFKMDGDGKVEVGGKEDLEKSKNIFMSIIKKIIEDPQVKVIVVDPVSLFKDFCTQRFFAMFNKVMPSLMKSPVDPTEGIRQTTFSIRNQEMNALIQKLRLSGRWVFLSFNMDRTPPQYQKEVDSSDIFNTPALRVNWGNRTPEDVDQISWCTRVPDATSTKGDRYYVEFKKGPYKPTNLKVEINDPENAAQQYFETIAPAIVGA